MKLMEHCQIWNQNDEYQKIIDAIEALAEEARTPELDCELARAYNNSADLNDRELYQKALALLKPHAEYFAGSHNWNFRMAYAYYYLGQEGTALRYFEKALEARPGDEDTEAFIDDCRRRVSLPQFADAFSKRVQEAWAAFLTEEPELIRLLELKDQNAAGETLIARCDAILHLAFADVSFELGFNGQKYELILTPEGDKARLFELAYFQHHAPAAVLERWNIWVGRQPSRGFELCFADWEISGQDVQVWAEFREEKQVSLTLYCEKLLPLLREDENQAWWMLSTLTDQVLGEIPSMALIDGFKVVDMPEEGTPILLLDLPQILEGRGLAIHTSAEEYLESCYLAYEREPSKDPDAEWRMDVFFGATRCPELINEYLDGESDVMDAYHQDGVVAGFFCYPMDAFPQEERGKTALDFRDALEAAVQGEAGEDAVMFLGGASGLFCGYLDFIAWDLNAVLDAATKFFKESALPWANFHVFRQNVGAIHLIKDGQDDITEKEYADEASDATGSFVGFVLLSEAGWDKEKLLHDLQAEWSITSENQEEGAGGKDNLVLSVGAAMAAVSLMPAPVPDREAEENAENNYMWPEAVETAKAHKAHLRVAVLGKDIDLVERGKLFVKVTACCCKQKNATGVYASGTVFEPRFYEGLANMMKDDELPIFNWIWFGLYRGEAGVCCYTYGMDAFGKEEMEVLDADAQPSEVRDFLAGLASYVLECGVTLNDGETIGFSENDRHAIIRSEGVSLPGMTLKIGYDQAEDPV